MGSLTHSNVCLIITNLFSVIGEQKITKPVQVREVLIPAVASQVVTPDGRPYKIEIICKNWQANQLGGWVCRYDDHAEIYYAASLNVCWSRWVICKELAHLLIDTEDAHFTKNPSTLVQELVSKLPAAKFEDEMNSEYLAIIAAIEMLLPWKYRQEMKQMMADGKTDYEIAHAFRAPEAFVNLLLRSPYGQISEQSNLIHSTKTNISPSKSTDSSSAIYTGVK